MLKMMGMVILRHFVVVFACWLGFLATRQGVLATIADENVQIDEENHLLRLTVQDEEYTFPIPKDLWEWIPVNLLYVVRQTIQRERLDIEIDVLSRCMEALIGVPATMEIGGDYSLKHGHDVCEWEGITCVATRFNDESDANELYKTLYSDGTSFRAVQGIDLSGQNLAGTVPSELSLLAYLTSLNLSGNKLTGTIPIALLSTRSLRHLDLSNNLLEGTLPVTLGDGETADTTKLSPLETLDLSINRLHGSLPSDNWHPALTGLRYLDLSRNSLSGRLPVLEMSEALPQLEFLWLGNNILSGTLADGQFDWASWGRNLEVLDLGSNVFTGSIPGSVSVLSLKSLILADNYLVGHLPWDLLEMSSLWTLQLQNNALSGSFPSDWSNLSNIGSLLLRYNEFSGSIPAKFVLDLQYSLRHLDVSHNKLTGTIASELGILRRLHTISASSNQLRGTLPNEMLDMEPNLRLNLSDNLLTGTIPSMFCGIGTANMLYREFGCDAVLCRPGTFSRHGHATLHSSCRECPNTEEGEAKSPPESTILGRTSCEGVDFVHGDLNGDGILSAREILRMMYVDTLGRFWGASFQPWADMRVKECDLPGVTCNDAGEIHTLDLSTANLCSDGDRRPGPIEFCTGLPAEIGELSSLEVLKIENRQFLRGSIPTEIGKLTNLQLLEISGCTSMWGTIPTEIGNLTKLRYFLASHSRFRGVVPTEIFGISSLVKLHLTNNLLTGTLPTEIGNLDQLKELMISRNNFEGTIPSEVGGLSSLENLEGYYNSFTGTIPSELGLCSELKRIDVFNNKFRGTLPEELTNVSVLQILHLKNNELTGTIPSRFGTLPYLSWFDLSSNKIHGTIPTTFGSIQSMRDFRFGGNMIHDPIPSGLCKNPNINGGITVEYGCDGVLCPLGTFSDSGHAVDGEGCTKCPDGQDTLYLGAIGCQRITEEDILSIFFEVMQGENWPADMKTNWGHKSISSCDWAGISCDSKGEIISLSFPLLGDQV